VLNSPAPGDEHEDQFLIKIRYANLPAGIHVRAEAAGRDIVVYLLPGLTPAQRRAALSRARSSARIGHGPALSAAGLARAIAADRVRMMARNSAAALRAHPALFVPPMIVLVSAALAYTLLGSAARLPASQSPFGPVGLSMIPPAHPRPAGSGPAPGGGGPGSPGPAGPGRTASPGPAPGPSQGGSPSPSATVAPPPARPARPGPARRPPGPFRSFTPSSSPAPTRTQTARPVPASPAPGSSPGSGAGGGSGPGAGSNPGGACVNLGALGVCLDV
jgi:hypothetical protein